MDLLTPGTGLIIWQAFVFLLLVVLLAKFAWKPILQALKERETSIQQALDAAEQARAEMARLQADNEKLLKAARDERDKMLKEARETANRLIDEARAEARKSADKIIDDARQAIQLEKQAALREVKVQVAQFALQIAGKLLRKNLESDKAQKELVESYLKDISVN
ncbi:MAG: F0F1 ATP synthase subunit B [Cyclobacteriaceae bacterium]|nr:F0F1 ATP synthase subunit B [Cyclobacteriaceae bacterium]MDW8330598.1 F0F1 ATP synthase subunit B [Cyclobacteriaceae bacterium]